MKSSAIVSTPGLLDRENAARMGAEPEGDDTIFWRSCASLPKGPAKILVWVDRPSKDGGDIHIGSVTYFGTVVAHSFDDDKIIRLEPRLWAPLDAPLPRLPTDDYSLFRDTGLEFDDENAPFDMAARSVLGNPYGFIVGLPEGGLAELEELDPVNAEYPDEIDWNARNRRADAFATAVLSKDARADEISPEGPDHA